MRVNSRPTISQARAICSSLPEVRAVIVLVFTKDDVAGASYGETKLECKQIGYTLDKIIEAICEGRIPVWGDLASEASAKARQRNSECDNPENGDPQEDRRV